MFKNKQHPNLSGGTVCHLNLEHFSSESLFQRLMPDVCLGFEYVFSLKNDSETYFYYATRLIIIDLSYTVHDIMFIFLSVLSTELPALDLEAARP